VSDGKRLQPLPGARRKTTNGFETHEFAQRRKKNRRRNDLAKAARKKNR